MQFSQQFIDQQIQQLRALQNDVTFLERRQAEAQKKIQDELDKKEKQRLARAAATKRKAAAAKALREQEKELGLPPSDPKKRVKEILKSRTQKKLNDEARQHMKILEPRIGGPNLEGKVKVRLSHNMEVWASPGYDIAKLKQKYLHRNQEVKPIGGKKAEPVPQELTPGMIYNLTRLGEL
jgi:preprotein translocase subunit SecD